MNHYVECYWCSKKLKAKERAIANKNNESICEKCFLDLNKRMIEAGFKLNGRTDYYANE